MARELDLTASALNLWVKHAQAERTKGKSGLMKEEREELARLRKEVRIVTEERDILKRGDGLLRQAKPVRFRFIAVEKASHLQPGARGKRLLFGLSAPGQPTAAACVRRGDRRE